MALDIAKLFENDDYVSPGSIGGKIKKIRELRGYTQKELGLKCGFSPSTADVRIAQYEKNKKVPREKALKDISAALGIDENALFDADLLPEDRMYHALFDLEDFHGLHPVEINGNIYLEFKGTTILGERVQSHTFSHFLSKWAEMYQKYLPTDSDSKKEKKQKAAAYTLWRYEYPENVVKEADERYRDQQKMDYLQSQLDELTAKTKGKEELAKLDSSLDTAFQDAKNNYKDITKESEFILFIKKMIEDGISIANYSPNDQIKASEGYHHVVSFKTEDIINNPSTHPDFAEFMCQLESMQKAGINITRRITAKNNELFVTYDIPWDQYKYVENLHKFWKDIIYITDRVNYWTDYEIDELNQKLLEKITGKHDVTFKNCQ